MSRLRKWRWPPLPVRASTRAGKWLGPIDDVVAAGIDPPNRIDGLGGEEIDRERGGVGLGGVVTAGVVTVGVVTVGVVTVGVVTVGVVTVGVVTVGVVTVGVVTAGVVTVGVVTVGFVGVVTVDVVIVGVVGAVRVVVVGVVSTCVVEEVTVVALAVATLTDRRIAAPLDSASTPDTASNNTVTKAPATTERRATESDQSFSACGVDVARPCLVVSPLRSLRAMAISSPPRVHATVYAPYHSNERGPGYLRRFYRPTKRPVRSSRYGLPARVIRQVR